MKHINTLLHQLLKQIPRQQFDDAVERHKGDYRVRQLNCWTQFCAMLYAQLTHRQSLRDLETAFNSKANYHYHLGVQPIRRSTLADANGTRPLALYKELFFTLLSKVRDSTAKEASQAIRLIDSTTIDLNKHNFSWAKFRSTKAGIKLHVVYDPELEVPTFFAMTPAKTNDRKGANALPIIRNATYVFDRAYNDYLWYYEQMHLKGNRFVGRMKRNTQYKVTQSMPVQDNVLEDQVIRLTSEKGKRCPIPLRRIRFVRQEDQKEIVLISNDVTQPASELMDLYKQRWEIELFFKWIKQNLRIKRFMGTSEHAVHLQVLIALITYLLLRLLKNNFPEKFSLQKLARLCATNLFYRGTLASLVGILLRKKPPSDSSKIWQESFQWG
jgi:IS4 transposase